MKKTYSIFLSKTNDPAYSKPLYTTQAVDFYSCSCQFNYKLQSEMHIQNAIGHKVWHQKPNHSKRRDFKITATGSYSVITYSHQKLVKEMQAGYFRYINSLLERGWKTIDIDKSKYLLTLTL